jgi:hypothetical protein
MLLHFFIFYQNETKKKDIMHIYVDSSISEIEYFCTWEQLSFALTAKVYMKNATPDMGCLLTAMCLYVQKT